MEAEFGQPQWVFGAALYGFASARQIVCSYTKNGRDYLATLDTETRALRYIERSLHYDFSSPRRRRPRRFHRRVFD